MFRNIFFLCLVILTAAPLSAQMGRQLTLEDYYSVKSVGSPLISPSGDWIAYTVSHRIEETNAMLSNAENAINVFKTKTLTLSMTFTTR